MTVDKHGPERMIHVAVVLVEPFPLTLSTPLLSPRFKFSTTNSKSHAQMNPAEAPKKLNENNDSIRNQAEIARAR